ncbi:bifunctional (p)ppGpp synthetase/guanosine-3',5'-bis(diphosphate) 3'-pyrophosphohydrolase [bacterium]|nr:bifunctional (p)ppGpp synthetase/guanosine-3',5'-bis(diphosphate) 3'-pyrophosphohydrolase [bacterium]
MESKVRKGLKKPAGSQTRKDAEFFDKFNNFDFVESRFHAFIARYKFQKSEKLMIRKALDFAKLAHNGQKRDEGTPYIMHPLRVANILMDEVAAMKSDIICTALLHDVIEDCGITMKELKNNFNESIAQMVKILTKDPSIENHKRVYVEIIMNSSDPVKLVKVCDRLDNLRSLRFSTNKTKMRRYISETEKKYVPMAEVTNNYIFRELKHELSVIRNRMRR